MIGAIMDWDTYSLEKPKYPQKSQRVCEIIPQKTREASVSLTPMEEYAHIGVSMGSWKIPLEVYPQILTGKLNAYEIEELKIQNTVLFQKVSNLQKENSRMWEEIKLLKLQLSDKKNLDELWKISDQNVSLLDDIFNLDDIKTLNPESALRELKGILKDCRSDGINSDDIVRSIRGE
jgi:hypothetical protein